MQILRPSIVKNPDCVIVSRVYRNSYNDYILQPFNYQWLKEARKDMPNDIMVSREGDIGVWKKK